MLTVVRQTANVRSARSEGPYTGELWRDLFHQDKEGNAFGKVFFTPCARTYWHSHPGGQLLVVQHGEGLVGDEHETVRISAGDLVWTPAGTRHWHGATATRSMMHLAITFGGVDWQEELADADYAEAEARAT
ncbi:cupin domain-containing protein [Amycolatopsis sp. K13G38]|uniref:Cupin domain-containing protein n=1 Tax=Amycolatopsis acididurans TaxID=2724524 RepID=A0ABX1J7K2_9PSEU|nr:cupin domain-containing protein [Amycolatopsis acididurans]NKQ55549.1 cupin domain-containing protein [Amycolatopsis acididurans]